MSQRYTMSRSINRSDSSVTSKPSGPSAVARAREFFAKAVGIQPAGEDPTHVGFNLQMDQGNVVDRLPEPARTKFCDIRQLAADRHAAANAINENLSDVRADKQGAESRLRRLTSAQGAGGDGLAQDAPAVIAQRAVVERLSGELSRLQKIYDDRNERWRSAAGIAQEIETYLKSCGRVRLTPAFAPPKVGRDFATTIEKARAKVEDCRADIAAVMDAPRPSAECKRLAREKIEELAERGRPNVMASIEGGRPFEFAMTASEIARVSGMDGLTAGSVGIRSSFDGEATFAWLHRDALLAAIDREIDANADDASALDDDSRATRLSEAKMATLAAERAEETIVEAALNAGFQVERRRDADPRAVLGLADDMPAPRAN